MARINELTSVDELRTMFTGYWSPSEDKFLGMDFEYRGCEYRLHTGAMYKDHMDILPDGRKSLFNLYRRDMGNKKAIKYVLMGGYATMDELLSGSVVDRNKTNGDVIMDDSTKILGYD